MSKRFYKKYTKKQKIQLISILGVLGSILIVFEFVPFLGYISMPWGVNITLMHIIVGLMAVTLYTKFKVNPILSGVGTALSWAALHHIQEAAMPNALSYLWINPLYNAIPKFLWGLTIGSLLILCKKQWHFILWGAALGLFNAAYVLSMIHIFKPVGYQYFEAMILVTNTLPESGIASIVTYTFVSGLRWVK